MKENYINGKWIRSDQSIEVTNPATGDIVAEGAYAGKKEAKKACCGLRCKKADRSIAS
ncbi:hypothetical protein ACWBUX_00270 [Bacillus atrophaeus]|uniref:hypothetical protein n=1 Tax=Bacillus atrophaeus TaxID=1452 RepID=UPI0031BB5848